MNTLRLDNSDFHNLLRPPVELRHTKSIVKHGSVIKLSIPVPASFKVISVTWKFRTLRRNIEKMLDEAIGSLDVLDDREQMNVELQLVDMVESWERDLLPTMEALGKSKTLLMPILINELRRTLNVIRNASVTVTQKVYPKQEDPANNPESFKKLLEAYKNVDLSDWRELDKNSTYKPLNKHAHI